MRRRCCCKTESGCTETTAQGIAEYLRDNFLAQIVVESGDFLHTCPSGNCTPVIGTYTLPFNFLASSFGTYEVEWRDSFPGLTICGAFTTLSAWATFGISGPVSGLFTITYKFNATTPSGVNVNAQWSLPTSLASCNAMLEPQTLPGVVGFNGPSVGRCKTATGGVHGPVVMSFV